MPRKQMERWLLRNDFSLKSGRKTGHLHFKGHDVTITLLGHGPTDISKKHVGMILRQLESAGFEKETVLRQLKG